MTVTEFAILRLSAPPLRKEVRESLESATRAQDEWLAAHFPGLSSSASERAAAWFEETGDPSRILTTARWDSVAAHWQWIRSDVNVDIMTGLDKHNVSNDTVLFHVGADIFDDSAPSGSVPLLQSPVISLARMSVAPENKQAFAARFAEVKGILEQHVSPFLVRFGWREELEAEAKEEEFVVVCGGESIDSHLKFSTNPVWSQDSQIVRLTVRVDVRHYKRFL